MNVADAYQLAVQEYQAGNKARAVDIIEQLLQEQPSNGWLAGELGGIMVDLGRRGIGAALLQLACSIEKERGIEDWRHWSTLGSTMEHLEFRDLAREAFDEALRVDPSVSDIYDQYSGTYVNAGEPEKCIAWAKKALELNPNNVIAKKHLGLGKLEAGEWAEGWQLLENRKLIKDYQRPKYALPEWKGEAVDTLIIHGEQGIGDEIMYLSLIPKLRHKVKRLVVEVTPRLVPLIRRTLKDCEVYGSLEECAANGAFEMADLLSATGNASANTVDLEGVFLGDSRIKPSIVSCASLPYVLGLGRNDVLSAGYLIPDPVRVDYWRNKMAEEAKGKPIVGLTWEGGVRKTHKKVRNPPFDLMQKFVLDHPEFCWVSVQYTHGEITHKSMRGTLHFQQAVDDLDEQAALLSALDLLVSVPQTAVHIAGAMAVPTLALVSKSARWDFCSSSEQMPWWESVRMIRQTEGWEPVFEQLDGLLSQRFQTKRNVINEAAE
jgi:tetratricopeptide (TPR) repeat protein